MLTKEQRKEGRRLTDLEVRQLRDLHSDDNYTIRSPLCVEVCDELLELRKLTTRCEDIPELLGVLKELLEVDEAWHGSVNSHMAKARSHARRVIKAIEGKTGKP